MQDINAYLSKGNLVPLSAYKQKMCIDFCRLKLIQEND